MCRGPSGTTRPSVSMPRVEAFLQFYETCRSSPSIRSIVRSASSVFTSLRAARDRMRKVARVTRGMAGGGVRRRLEQHARGTKKESTHFSVYEVRDNINPELLALSQAEAIF